MYSRILVPTDGSPHSNRAIKAAAALAKATRGKITFFHVIPQFQTPYYPDGGFISAFPTRPEYVKETSAKATKMFDKAKKLLGKGLRATGLHAYSDTPASAILSAARRVKADVIVMASHGRHGFVKLLLGSETQKVIALSKIPVLVVK